MSKNTKYWILGIGAVLALLITIQIVASASASSQTPAVSGDHKVITLQFTETVETSGKLEAQPFSELKWKTSGVVETVNVNPGDTVKAGDVLATLRPSSTSASLASAQADLIAAQEYLNDLLVPSEAAIGQANINLSAAYTAQTAAREDLLDELAGMDGDDDLYDDVINARDDLNTELEEFSLASNQDAQFYYWAVRQNMQNKTGGYDYSDLSTELKNALEEDDIEYIDAILDAEKKFDLTVSRFKESISNQTDALNGMTAIGQYQQADAALLSAIEAVYAVVVSPSLEDVAAAQARVDAAQASVNNLSVIAPFDGMILSVEHYVGQVVDVNTVAVALADVNHLFVRAQMDEADVMKVGVGNPVEVTLDAMPDILFTGSVLSINPVGDSSSGSVKYTVLVALDEVTLDAFPPIGATANAKIMVSEERPALAVPLSMIQNDNEGEFVWVVKADGNVMRVNILSGEIVGDYVVVTGDLQEGDALQAGERENTTQGFGPFSR